jgi:SAM-dependent methyltransferase
MSTSIDKPSCAVCDQSGNVFYTLKRLQRVVYCCPSCGFKWTCPPLHYDDSDSGCYYEAPPYVRCKNSDEAKARTHMTNLLKYVNLSSVPVPTLLEVGCSNGSLLALFAEAGFSVEGLEISRAELAECKKRGITAHAVTIEDFHADRKFGVVLSAHVIEHLRDVNHYFHSASKFLVPGGLNVFLTPNGGAALFALFRQYWAPATPDEHNIFLTTKAVKLLAEKHGFDVVTIANTGRYFSPVRGMLAEIYKGRRAKKLKSSKKATAITGISTNSAPRQRGKREVILRALGYVEWPVINPLHSLLTRLGLSDELLCVLRKR